MKEHNEDRERGGREEGNNNVVVARCSFPLFFVLPFPPEAKVECRKFTEILVKNQCPQSLLLLLVFCVCARQTQTKQQQHSRAEERRERSRTGGGARKGTSRQTKANKVCQCNVRVFVFACVCVFVWAISFEKEE